MRHYWILRIVKGIAFFAVLVLALGFIVMVLWNGIIPNLFNGPLLTYWQAVGLLLLTHILLRGWTPWRCGGGLRYGR
jgi:multisubunit Na+/H+ antiporter MnhB subunit